MQRQQTHKQPGAHALYIAALHETNQTRKIALFSAAAEQRHPAACRMLKFLSPLWEGIADALKFNRLSIPAESRYPQEQIAALLGPMANSNDEKEIASTKLLLGLAYEHGIIPSSAPLDDARAAYSEIMTHSIIAFERLSLLCNNGMAAYRFDHTWYPTVGGLVATPCLTAAAIARAQLSPLLSLRRWKPLPYPSMALFDALFTALSAAKQRHMPTALLLAKLVYKRFGKAATALAKQFYIIAAEGYSFEASAMLARLTGEERWRTHMQLCAICDEDHAEAERVLKGEQDQERPQPEWMYTLPANCDEILEELNKLFPKEFSAIHIRLCKNDYGPYIRFESLERIEAYAALRSKLCAEQPPQDNTEDECNYDSFTHHSAPTYANATPSAAPVQQLYANEHPAKAPVVHSPALPATLYANDLAPKFAPSRTESITVSAPAPTFRPCEPAPAAMQLYANERPATQYAKDLAHTPVPPPARTESTRNTATPTRLSGVLNVPIEERYEEERPPARPHGMSLRDLWAQRIVPAAITGYPRIIDALPRVGGVCLEQIPSSKCSQCGYKIEGVVRLPGGQPVCVLCVANVYPNVEVPCPAIFSHVRTASNCKELFTLMLSPYENLTERGELRQSAFGVSFSALELVHAHYLPKTRHHQPGASTDGYQPKQQVHLWEKSVGRARHYRIGRNEHEALEIEIGDQKESFTDLQKAIGRVQDLWGLMNAAGPSPYRRVTGVDIPDILVALYQHC